MLRRIGVVDILPKFKAKKGKYFVLMFLTAFKHFCANIKVFFSQ